MWTPGVDPTSAKNRRLSAAYERINRAAKMTPAERSERERVAFEGTNPERDAADAAAERKERRA